MLADEILKQGNRPVFSGMDWKVSRFIFHAPEAKSVRIAGTFNNWSPTDDYLMEKE
jgi:hypothetical protein